ncbi:MAG: addiction module protein [Chthonomonadales bacterium]
MSATLDRYKEELSRLSSEERAELADFLNCSLPTQMDPDVEEVWDTEIERRCQAYDSGQMASEPAEQVLERMRN